MNISIKYTGWIALPRTFLEDDWLKTPEYFTLFVYLLLRARHEPGICKLTVNRKTGKEIIEQHLKEGELIIGRFRLAKDLAITQSKARTLLNKLQKNGHISLKPTNSYTVVSINKWNEFQFPKKHITTISPPNEQHLTTNNNVNNENNVNRDEGFINLIEIVLNEPVIKDYKLIRNNVINRLKEIYNITGIEKLREAFAIVIDRIERGQDIKDPIAYVVKILEAD